MTARSTAAPGQVFVFAENYTIARAVAEVDLGLRPREWRHVDREDRLRGRPGGVLIVDGSAARRRDYEQVLGCARHQHMDIRYVGRPT